MDRFSHFLVIMRFKFVACLHFETWFFCMLLLLRAVFCKDQADFRNFDTDVGETSSKSYILFITFVKHHIKLCFFGLRRIKLLVLLLMGQNGSFWYCWVNMKNLLCFKSTQSRMKHYFAFFFFIFWGPISPSCKSRLFT